MKGNPEYAMLSRDCGVVLSARLHVVINLGFLVLV
jgi:hypothetical protein